MSPQTVVYLISLIAALLIAILVQHLLSSGLRGLLDDVVALPAATLFYLRAFTIVVFFAALAAVVSKRTDIKEGARFMEYVWSVATSLQEVLQELFIVLLIFAGLMVVLTAALRRKH